MLRNMLPIGMAGIEMTKRHARAILIPVLVILLGLSLSGKAHGQADVTPPSFVGISVSPTTADISEGPDPVAVTVTVELTDDLSGVQQWQVEFKSPSGNQSLQVSGSPGLLTGTILNGTFQGAATLSQSAEAGRWNAAVLSITDGAGNNTTIDYSNALFPPFFRVVSQQDATPPSLVSISVSPETVDVREGQAPVTVTVDLSDDLAGVQQWQVQFNSPSGSQSLQVSGSPGLIAGTTLNGTFQGTSTLPQFAEAGTWTAASLSVTDGAGNSTAVNLAAAGFPLSLTVVSQQDVTPPSLVSISVSPETVDVREGQAPVTVTVDLTDDLAGVQQWQVQFDSPSGNQSLQVSGSPGLIAGTILSGTFGSSATLLQSAEAGTWTAAFLSITDEAGNNTSVDLVAAGFPIQFEVAANQSSGLPTLPANSVVNGASFRAATEPGGALAPGAIVSFFGTNLAEGPGLAESVPLPTALLGTSVTFNGTEAPLFTVSGGQINAQVPFELLPGEASVQVTRGDNTSEVQTVTVAAVSPGIFAVNQQGTGQGAILIANTATIAAPNGSVPGREARPANRQEFISIFCTGLGDVTNRPPSGEAPSGNELSVTRQTPTVTIGGIEVSPSFSGLSSFVGLYQVNVQVPSNAATGDAVEVRITIGGNSSNTVTMAIQ